MVCLCPHLEQSIKIQMHQDRRTGTPGLSECGWGASPFKLDKLEGQIAAEAEAEIIAICSIINSLYDRVQELMELPETPLIAPTLSPHLEDKANASD